MSSRGLKMVCESKQSNETEFIKPFFYDIEEYINIQKLLNVPDKYKKKKMRLTLDYEEDFEMFKSVIEYFLDESKEMEFEDIIKYIEEKLFMFVLYIRPHTTLANDNAPISESSGCGTCAISSQNSNIFLSNPGGLNKSFGFCIVSDACIN